MWLRRSGIGSVSSEIVNFENLWLVEITAYWDVSILHIIYANRSKCHRVYEHPPAYCNLVSRVSLLPFLGAGERRDPSFSRSKEGKKRDPGNEVAAYCNTTAMKKKYACTLDLVSLHSVKIRTFEIKALFPKWFIREWSRALIRINAVGLKTALTYTKACGSEGNGWEFD